MKKWRFDLNNQEVNVDEKNYQKDMSTKTILCWSFLGIEEKEEINHKLQRVCEKQKMALETSLYFVHSWMEEWLEE